MRRRIRIIGMLLIIVMLVGMAGCGGTPAAPTASPTAAAAATAVASTTAPAESATAAATESAPEVKPLEPVTLKVYGFIAPPEPGIQNDPVSKKILADTGITIDANGVTEAEWLNQFNAMLASNDLPDIFFIPDVAKTVATMVKGGTILKLDDLVAANAPNLNADPKAKAMLMLQKQTISPDGNLYSIGMCKGTWDAGVAPLVGNFIRWDLYKQLGYPEMKNWDTDLLDVLKKMGELEKTTKGGLKVYPIGAWFGDGAGWGEWPLHACLTFTEGIQNLTTDRMITADIITGSPSTVNVLKTKDSVFWREIKWFNKANQMGILDPESFTQKYDQYTTKLNAGRYLYTEPRWVVEAVNKFFITDGTPEKALVCLPTFTDTMEVFWNMPAGERPYGISAVTKYPERAVQLLDYMSTYEFSRIALSGVEGDTWNMVDGKPVPTPDFLNATIDPAYTALHGATLYHHMMGYADGTVDPKTGVSVHLKSNSPQAQALNLTPMHKDFMTHFGANTMLDVYTQKATAGYQGNLMYNLGDLPDELKTLDTNLIQYVFTAAMECVQAKDDAAFTTKQDAFIAGLDKFKVDDIFAYWLKKAQEQETSLKPIADLLK